MHILSRVFRAALLMHFVLSGTASWAAGSPASAPEDVIPAVILKVEGTGIASVRKRSGVVESAGARGKVYVGDRVITDAHSAVHLMLNDGSVLKVGFNSEFLLAKVENKRRYLSWFFKLLHGTIRALAEKVPAQETHLRVETPSGTVGVRGTEFVLVYDDVSAGSSLYLLDGLVSYGATGCEMARNCLDVRGGESATMAKGAARPTTPAVYVVKDLFGLGQPAASGANAEARMSLFRDARRVQAKAAQSMDENALKKILEESTAELAAAQDRAIGRTQEQRQAMHGAIESGTYESIMASADAFAAARGGLDANSNGGAENLVAQVAAAKFRLGAAVRAADSAGLFLDKPAPDLSRKYQLRKNVDYDQGKAAKSGKEELAKSADDYKDTLEYAEALSAAQVPAGDTPAGLDTDADTLAPKKAKAAPAACDSACEGRRIAHELDVTSEGTAAAYQAPMAAAYAPAAAAVPSKRGGGGLPGYVTTRFFRRTVPGDSCYRTQMKCTMQPCAAFGRGRKCKAGETVQVCESKQVPVRCED